MTDASRYDVIVVGAGPGGLAAAWAAASRGKRVALLDENFGPGGQIWRSNDADDLPGEAKRWIANLKKTSCDVMSRTAVVARPAEKVLLAETPDGPIRFEFEKLIFATGSRELFLPFPGWTLRGVFGAGGLQALVKSGLPVKGRHIVVAGSGPLLLAVADCLRRHGAEIVGIAEQAPAARVYRFGINLASRPSKLLQAVALRAKLSHVPYDFGWWVRRAEGDERVQQVTLASRNGERTYPCDMLACAYGLIPNVELPLLFGCELNAGFVRTGATMETSVPGVFCVGEPVAIGGSDAAVVQGLIAGAAAAGDSAGAKRHQFSRRRWARFSARLAHAFALRHDMRTDVGDDTPVCRCEDVTLRKLKNHESWRDAKLQTRAGMGPCQGRVCGAACEYLFGWKNEAVRPPVLAARAETFIAPPRA